MTSQWARWRLKSPASRLFTQPFIQAQIKETSKLRVTGLCMGNSPVTSELPAQMASNAANVSIWWRHHVCENVLRHGPTTTAYWQKISRRRQISILPSDHHCIRQTSINLTNDRRKATYIPIKTRMNQQGWWLLDYNYLSAHISQTGHVSYSFGYWELFVKNVTDAYRQPCTEMTSAKCVHWHQWQAKLTTWLSAWPGQHNPNNAGICPAPRGSHIDNRKKKQLFSMNCRHIVHFVIVDVHVQWHCGYTK